MSNVLDVTVPTVGESISEVQIGQWLKQEGEWVEKDEDLVEIETEKASVQIPAPAAGYLRSIRKQEEEFATVGEVIAAIEPADAPADGGSNEPASAPPAANSPADGSASEDAPQAGDARVMPAAQRMLDDLGLQADQITATGPGGRLLKEDVVAHVQRGSGSPPAAPTPPPAPAAPAPAAPAPARQPAVGTSLVTSGSGHRGEEVKPLSMIRRTIANRLVQAQQTAALLTTFNEINMQPVMELRKKYRDAFADKHGVKLGFMSFFAKAAVEALRRFPAVNSEVRGNNIVYRQYYDIGIAIGGGKGLVVPVLRNVEDMSFAVIERSIAEFAELAGANQLQPNDLEGGTFTISNGGIYGSLLSTPIVNPPQSGILGLHSIQERPVAERGQVVIRPMMYIALTYDHRVVDGREAVTFLKTIKDVLEDPARLFLEV
ncbi:2-oxoglutarate dehydrogenase complex dihydrolipoyllysine-residue succinyltransferase [Roseimaritima ulvae]|uniref:2-oxoglutarate dehydrogenase complex dihydrolipoyllysine-residue succinyltransferase n=1 Tax=Roseimaritima ulvae TaxID=980254 RepID=UPI00082E35FD|nr:2-oxoglutarate dehydrogenase complex dihydrolipoyllysine-residue succinyltransferase [Roseimaritima ulvae]